MKQVTMKPAVMNLASMNLANMNGATAHKTPKSNQKSSHKTPTNRARKIATITMMLAALATTSVTSMPLYANTVDEVTVIEQNVIGSKQAKTDKENIGFGTGALIGGIAAGPLGAIIAGVGGVFIVKFINVNDDNEVLSAALTQEQTSHRLAKTKAQRHFDNKLQRLEHTYQQQLATLAEQQQSSGQLQADNLLMSLQFSTGSSDIAAHYQEQVSVLAQLLNNAPEMKIDLSGYTDLTGEPSLNQTLSQARVNAVKTLLMAQGVAEQQIATFAFGEDAPVVANEAREVSFYDRRVVMKLHKGTNTKHTKQQVANNH